MTPDFRKRYQTNPVLSAFELTERLKALEQECTQSEIRAEFHAIDELKNYQKQTMNDKNISAIIRGWMCNKMEEEIQATKERIKSLVDRY